MRIANRDYNRVWGRMIWPKPIKENKMKTKHTPKWCTQHDNGLHILTTYDNGTFNLENKKTGSSVTMDFNKKDLSKLLDVIFERD